jgi:WD40 repeat protein
LRSLRSFAAIQFLLSKVNVLVEIGRSQVDDHVIALAWAPDSSRCAALSASGSLTLASLAADKNESVLAHPAGGLALSWGKPGILTAGQEGKVSLWQQDEDGSLVKRFEVDPGEGWVGHVLWSSDGTRFVTGAGKKLRLWSDSGELLQDYSNQSSSIAALCLRPDNQAVGIAMYGGVRLYRFTESEPYEDLAWKGSIVQTVWSPNGRFIAASSQERTINFWRLPFRPGQQLTMSGYPRKVRELAWDKDSRYLATGGCEIITVWDVSGKGAAGTRPIQLKFHQEALTALQFQPLSTRLASGSKDGKLAIWKSVKEKQPEFVAEFDAPISTLDWSPGGKQLGVGTSDGEVVLFSAVSS